MLLTALQAIAAPEEIPVTARSPEGARAGLLYRAGEWEKAHDVVQDSTSGEGSFWHGILHRHERDWPNAAYWFRIAGRHPTFPAIHASAAAILKNRRVTGWHLSTAWDPFLFLEWCQEAARQPGSDAETVAIAIQAAEWDCLFHWCMESPLER